MVIMESPQKYEIKTEDGEVVPVPTGIGILYDLCCGCGQPGRFFKVVLEYLEGIEGDNNVGERLGEDDGFYFLANVMSEIAWREPHCSFVTLTEHGGTIFYCWLTDAGRDAMEFLRKYQGIIFENFGGRPRMLPEGKWGEWESGK